MIARLQALHELQYPERYAAKVPTEDHSGGAGAVSAAAAALARAREKAASKKVRIEKNIGDAVVGGLEVPSAVWWTDVPDGIDQYVEQMSRLMWQVRIDPPMKLVITQRTLKYQTKESHAFNKRFRNFYTGASGGDQYTGPMRQVRTSYSLLTSTVLPHKQGGWLRFLSNIRATLPEAVAALPAVVNGTVAESDKLTVASGNVEELVATDAYINKLKADVSSDPHECAICQSEFEVGGVLHKIKGCVHHYCKDCLEAGRRSATSALSATSSPRGRPATAAEPGGELGVETV